MLDLAAGTAMISLVKMNPSMTQPPSPNLTRTMLTVLFIGILIAACFWMVRPFLSSLIWAAMTVIATWPFFLNLQARLWGKRWLALLVMIVVLLLVLIIPVCFAILTIVDQADDIVGWAKSLAAAKVPPPPEWLQKIPYFGSWAVEHWQRLSVIDPQELSKMVAPYASQSVGWFVNQAGNFGMLLLHFFFSVVIAAVLYLHGESAAGAIRSFARRLAGPQGEAVAVFSAKAVRGVALGIVITALVQSTLGGLGLFFAGVPAAALLGAVMLLCCILQVGPGLVLAPAAIWLFWRGEIFTASIFSVWAIFVCTMDNFLRPFFIRKGVDLPVLLILAGVFGGLLAFGIIGLFIGPVILAVTYKLLRAWVLGTDEPAGQGTAPAVETPAAPASKVK